MPGPARYAVSLHDVAPSTWSRCERLLELADRHGSPVTLLVVPRLHGGTPVDADRAFGLAVARRVARGDEVVLHGYYHLDDAPPPQGPIDWLRRRFYTDGEGEFDAIDEATARARLADGRARLASARLCAAGFVAPAWLLGRAARRAVETEGFAYTSTRETLIRLADGLEVPAPSLVYATRSRWRRIASAGVLAVRLASLARAPLVRIALHPGDADHPRVLARWERAFARLAATRSPVLESDWLGLSGTGAASAPAGIAG